MRSAPCRSRIRTGTSISSASNEIRGSDPANAVRMPHLSGVQWLLAIVAATGIGVSKAGFPGVGLAHVVIFAFLFGPRSSTGVVLPMLLIGDTLAAVVFRQHAQWSD